MVQQLQARACMVMFRQRRCLAWCFPLPLRSHVSSCIDSVLLQVASLLLSGAAVTVERATRMQVRVCSGYKVVSCSLVCSDLVQDCQPPKFQLVSLASVPTSFACLQKRSSARYFACLHAFLAGDANEDDEVADDDTLVDPAEYDPSAISLQDLLRQQQEVRASVAGGRVAWHKTR